MNEFCTAHMTVSEDAITKKVKVSYFDDLDKNDFLLAIQTEYQHDMMIKYGEKVICMDDTHGSNMYDFTLITVLVIDDYRKGIPIAWALSNRVDKALLTQF